MGDVTAVNMDVITEKSGHTMVPNAVSVCLTPAAPAPLPIPYPVVGSTSDGVTNPTLRTKINGAKVIVVGADFTACHGNEAGTLKEVVSLNTGGPCFIIMGAPTVLCELGMMGITGSPGFLNKQKGMDAGGSASDAGGAGGGGGGGGGGSGPGGSPTGPQGPAGGGGGGGGGSGDGAAVTSKTPHELAAEHGDTQAHKDAREKVAKDFYAEKCPGMKQSDIDSAVAGIDKSKPVKIVKIPPDGGGPGGNELHQHTFPGKTGQYFAKDKTTTADQLGANNKVLMNAEGNTPPRVVPRKPESFTADPNKPATGLQSTSAPIEDTWSHSGEPKQCAGGGTQVFVPRSEQSGVTKNG